ncbi:MAG TPA: EAL domain-containing protein, partial [Frankiaceae bacterium]|nr:EAL domain-containing protein [Frankiaceae bacterium]
MYAADRDPHGRERLRMAGELRQTVAAGGLTVHYQPKGDLPTGLVRGVEALVRWQHPRHGLVGPDTFLSLAEDAGMMVELTHTVLSQSLRQAAAWRAAGVPLSVAVNLSASSVVDAELPARVAGLLAEHALPADSLLVEITEQLLMADRVRAQSVLAELRRLGVQVGVDDYGTGYSSLAYLRELPIDELKLDRSFVSPLASDAGAATIVRSTIELAH